MEEFQRKNRGDRAKQRLSPEIVNNESLENSVDLHKTVLHELLFVSPINVLKITMF